MKLTDMRRVWYRPALPWFGVAGIAVIAANLKRLRRHPTTLCLLRAPRPTYLLRGGER